MTTRCTVVLDGQPLSGRADQPLIDFLKERGVDLPHVCYHPSLGALETCDACWVEVGGELKRGCTLNSAEGLTVSLGSQRARAAREEGMDRLLAKHELYCTVCENNNGDCTLHNTMVDMQIPIQRYEFQRKPHKKDTSSPFYPYDPDQCTQLESLISLPPSHSTRGFSLAKSMESVSLTSTFWHASTQRPQRMH